MSPLSLSHIPSFLFHYNKKDKNLEEKNVSTMNFTIDKADHAILQKWECNVNQKLYKMCNYSLLL